MHYNFQTMPFRQSRIGKAVTGMAEMKPWLMIPDGKPNGKEDVKIYMITIPKWVAVIILLIAKMSGKMYEPELH